jgi:hypothetical protein
MARAKIGAVLVFAALAVAALPASQASARTLVEFEPGAAAASNGSVPPVPGNPLEEVKEACGSETEEWGHELFTTPPSEIKVKNEWGDIIPGKEMEISGKITNVEFSNGDIATDHPFSRDFTFDVLLDEPYWDLARSLGPGAPEGAGNESDTHEIHVEMETGALLHKMPQHEGPASGEPWEILPEEGPAPTLSEEALENIETPYVPKVGDRVAMKGRWIIDCGHNDFHSELHQITLAAFGHSVGSTTQVHVLTNPYRDSQLYGFNGVGSVNSTASGKPFPEAFEASVEALVRNAVIGVPQLTALSLQSELERTLPSPTPIKVCSPEGFSGKGKASYAFTERKGYKIKVKTSKLTHCATISSSLTVSKYTAKQPAMRTCAMPWPWLSAKIAGALGATAKSNEVETITVNATGGTFTITYGAETTGPIAFNATAKEVEEALEALPVLKPGDITVTGGPGAEHPYVLTFGGELAETAITPVTTDRSALTGGKKLASVVVVRPGGALDLRRFILSLIEQKEKIALEEAGQFEDITHIEEKMAVNPFTSCADPLSAPPVAGKHTTNNNQPFPFYGQLLVQ